MLITQNTQEFAVDGVEGVFFGSDFITVTKNENLDWQVLKPILLGTIMDHYSSGENVIDEKIKSSTTNLDDEKNEQDTDIVKQIKELLDTGVRPAVAMDGGDIIYQGFKEGVVFLHMQGACAGCLALQQLLKWE